MRASSKMRVKDVTDCETILPQKPYLEFLKSASVATGCVFLGVASSLVACLVGLHLMGDSWMQRNDVVGSYFTMTPAALVGLYLVMVSIALGPSLLGLGMLSIIRLKPFLKNAWSLSISSNLIAMGILVSIVLSGVYLIDALSPYTWYQPLDGVPKLNTLNQLCGCLLVSAYSVLLIGWVYYTVESRNAVSAFKMILKASHMQANSMIYSGFNLINFGVLFGSFALIFLLTLFLPHVWAITYMPVIAWNAYFVQDSPFSLINGVLLYEKEIEHYSYQNITYQNITSTDPNTARNITSLEYLPDPDWLQPKIYLKLYQTVVVYYSFIIFIVLCGITGTYYAPVRRKLHWRINMSIVPHRINLWPLGATVGELLLTASLTALYSYWFWYWAVGWSYRSATVIDSEKDLGLETYARVMGQMAILTMSFLTFPVAHNSVWESVFGVPFDRAIKYHRALGVLFWIFATLHMMLYEIKWLRNGVFVTNAWAEPNSWVVEGTQEEPLIIRNSNWTIALMEFTWLLGTLTMSAALLRTTFRYELFVYTHIFMALFFILTFLHSFQSWYYTGAGLLLYAFDKIIRFVNASRQHTMLSVEHFEDPGVIRITLPSKTFRGGHSAGQFSWIQIPAVSAFEWHPFTISSSPCQAMGENGTVSFSIKALKPGSWTHNLGEFAKRCSRGEVSQPSMDIAIDGPYGRSINYMQHSTVILIAGGIGVTPMMSIFHELASRMSNPQMGDVGDVKQVHLIWSIRESSLFDLFAFEVITPLVKKTPGVNVHLYVTGAARFAVPSPEMVLACMKASSTSEEKFKSLEEHGDPHRSVLDPRSIIPAFDEARCDEIFSSHKFKDNSEDENADMSCDGGFPIADSIERPAEARLNNFTITFGRPNYATLLDGLHIYNAEDPDASVTPTVGTSPPFLSTGSGLGVVCMVCAPLIVSESISRECFSRNWTFQAEEFAI